MEIGWDFCFESSENDNNQVSSLQILHLGIQSTKIRKLCLL